MTVLDHLQELRRRLIISGIALLCAAIVCYLFYDGILSLLYRPLLGLGFESQADKILYVQGLFEGFVVRIRISLVAGLILSVPVHLFNIVRFVFPGLTRREKTIVSLSLAASFILILVSVFYAYGRLIPVSLRFLAGSGFIPPQVGVLLNFGRNIVFVYQFILGTVLVFQVPVLLELLLILKLVRRRTLLRSSRYVVIAIFILAAILTPSPDFISQLGLALPLVALYFLAILVAWIFRFGRD